MPETQYEIDLWHAEETRYQITKIHLSRKEETLTKNRSQQVV
jgi:hypothetical protein